MLFRFRCLLIAVVAIIGFSSVWARDFVLAQPRSSVVFGPYRFASGARCSLAGTPYEFQVFNDGRFSVKSLTKGTVFGPFQAVDNRFVNIDGVMYIFSWDAAAARRNLASGSKSAAEMAYEKDSKPLVAPDLPPEPEMPTRLVAPDDEPARHVAPKNLTDLPEVEDGFEAGGWLALLDRTPIDWKLNSKKGKESDLERITIGGDIFWNYWLARLTLSPSVKGGNFIPTEDGNASFDSGTGWSLTLGYNRPFLIESGWTASAGIRGMIKRDSGDLSSSSFVYSSEADTNGVYSVEKKSASTSVSLTEFSIWVDIGLSYAYEDWGCYTEFSFEPVSAYDVSGKLSYAGQSISLDVERASPVALRLGGWYDYDIYRFFADLTLASDTLFRIGCSFKF